MAGVISAADEMIVELFSGLSARQFAKLVRQLRREGAEPPLKGRPWKLAFEGRVLLVAAYWRTNLTIRQIAALFGTSKVEGGPQRCPRSVPARVEHALASMKVWRVLRDCRLLGQGSAEAMAGIARLHNLTITG